MNQTAPPQTPEAKAAEQTALAQREKQPVQSVASDMGVMAVAGRPDLERIEAVVTIPADYQYIITRWKVHNKVTDQDMVVSRGQSMTEVVAKRGITADGYDYINRALGASFYLPEWVHDQQGNPQRNPIHRKDYIYLRLLIVYYTPLGQLVSQQEDVEVDFNLTWMDARINSKSAKVVTDPNTGLPMWDAFGNPAVTLSDDDELKALKTLSQLRTFGPRYAQTVARVRLLKIASGIRSLPIEAPFATDKQVRIVGYRDKLTPNERFAKAVKESEAMYGRKSDIEPLRHEEMQEAGITDPDPDTEALDREAVAAQNATDEPSGFEAADAAWQKQQDEQAAGEQGEQAKAPWAAE